MADRDDETALMRRLYNARQNGRGMNLSPDDVQQLCADDAIGTRITNAAEEEAGSDDRGGDGTNNRDLRTWSGFVADLRAQMRGAP